MVFLIKQPDFGVLYSKFSFIGCKLMLRPVIYDLMG